jgi:hypothetical protein
MGRTTLTRTTPLGAYPSLPVAANALDAVMTGADVTNKNQFLLDAPLIIIAQNTDTVDRTVTLTSAPDAQKRTGDVGPYTLSADEIALFRIDQVAGWVQSDGYLYLEANNVAVKLGAIR